MNTSEGPTTLGVGEVESPSLPSLRPGELFAGRYQVGEVLGVGGFATVFRASDRVLRRDVALKLLRPERASPAAIRRLKREAALARDVAHPSLVRVFEIGESDGLVYLVLELVSGLSLARRIRAGALPLEEVLRIGGALLDGLGALHGAQILHRDIKPSNVLLGSDGAVKVCDFGLALPFDRDETRATVDGAFVGTVDYVAPEIALGDDATVQSDLYSFGVVLFEMIAGQPPFRANSSLGQLLAHLHKRPPELKRLRADVSPWLARYVEWLMAKEPSQRPETVAAARSAFAQRHARLTPRVRTRRWIQSLGAGLFLASAMALGVDAYRSTRFTELVHRPGEGFVALDRKGRTLWRWSDRPAGLHTIVATLESGGEPRVVGAAIDATGLALQGAALREDPDVVLVGEMRERSSGAEFLFVVNHLARGEADIRLGEHEIELAQQRQQLGRVADPEFVQRVAAHLAQRRGLGVLKARLHRGPQCSVRALPASMRSRSSSQGSARQRISASLIRMRCMMRDLSCASSGPSVFCMAACLSCEISSAQALSSLTTWSQLPMRAASSMSWLARSMAS